MKQINWYPGHMFKSTKDIQANLRLVDLVMIILDARIPYSSFNPDLEKLINKKPVLLLFNKRDLADPNNLNKWLNYYQNKGYYTLPIDAVKKDNLNKIYPLVRNVILKVKVEKMILKKRTATTFKTMILGIPNVGKSTFINSMSNKKVFKVENRPGVTKNLQWTKLSNEFEMLDTPGILWPKFDDDVKYNLALTGAIKDDILPLHDVVFYGLNYLIKNYPERLIERYQLNEINSTEQIIEQIGRRFGALTKGNLVDIERVYDIFLKDLRENRFGGVSFEEPR